MHSNGIVLNYTTNGELTTFLYKECEEWNGIIDDIYILLLLHSCTHNGIRYAN